MSTAPTNPPGSGWPPLPPRAKKFIAGILAALIAVGVTVTITDNGPGHPPEKPRGTVTITLGGQGKKKVDLPPAAQAVATAQATDDRNGDTVAAESDLHEQSTPSPSELAAGNDTAPAGQPAIPAEIPQAAPNPPKGCHDTFVRNQSSRNGAKVSLGVIHWTGSRSIPGTAADVLANVKWFDTPAAQASSNYIVDDDGNCYYTVPEQAKAWTQAAANPWAVSVEYTNPGVLPLFHGTAGRNRVLQLMRGWHNRWGIPYRRGAVNGFCVPTRSGFLAHRDLGGCGGGHPDVGPSPATVDALIRDAGAGTQPKPKPKVTEQDRTDCTWIHGYRGRKAHTKTGTASFSARLKRVRSHGVKCINGKAALA